MKILFPNPDDFVNDILGFFDQLELSVYHARKASEKILNEYTAEDIEEGNDTPWVQFFLNELDESVKKALEENDPDMEIQKHMGIEIAEA